MCSGRVNAAVFILFLVFALPAIAQQSCSNQATPQELDARIEALIAKMTIAERVAQLQDRAPAIPRLGV